MNLLTNQKGFKGALKTLCMVVLALTVSFSVSAQIQVSGVVSDASGTIPGVSVVVQGTTTGVLTGMNGDYTITVPSSNSVLQFSFIGYATQSITVGNQTRINVTLSEDVQQLDEIVVVGYSTQAKKDITGSVAVVSAEALAESTAINFSQALQGKSAGVYVSTTGAPGSGSKIRVRGVGSVSGSDPLVIIDGVSGGTIASVNSNDIETFQVLKDASATAIYGAQGANGVIIITTKQGTKTGQARVSYNGYVGVSTMANDGYDLLNGWELMEFVGEGFIRAHNVYGTDVDQLSHAQFGGLKNIQYGSDGTTIVSANLEMPYAVNPAGRSYDQILATYNSDEEWVASYVEDATHGWMRSAFYQNLIERGYTAEQLFTTNADGSHTFNTSAVTAADLEYAKQGTNWYDYIVQKGFIQSHSLSLVGGNDKGQYSLSVAYDGQEGTIKSSYYNRYSIRANSEFKPRSYITFGVNSSLAYTDYQGDRGSQGDGSPFALTYTVKSWVPAYNVAGKFGGTRATDGGRNNTALAYVSYQEGDWNRSVNTQNSLYLEIKPITGLTLRTQGSARIGGSWSRSFSEFTNYYNKEGTSYNSLSENASWNSNFQWTNTATYTKKFGSNNLTVMIGSEALAQGYGRSIGATRRNYTAPENENTWIINNGSTANVSNSGTQGSKTSMFGLFARVDYDYAGKYLATITVRRDAASKFAEDYRWGTFPSISLGWRISDESFMSFLKPAVNDLKLRAGYGTTGNSNIGAYNWATSYSTGTSYHYAINGSNNGLSTGYGVSSLGYTAAKWETVKMFNVGFDLTAFRRRFDLTFDYYIKKTSDMLVPANWSALAGSASKPNINIGDMKNTGFDVQAGWNDKVGKFSYGLSVNVSQYKNEVVRLGSSNLYTSTRITNLAITTPGQPVNMFYGYKVLGIYQSVDDVTGYKNDANIVVKPYGITESTAETFNPNSYVGRFKFQDTNNDGFINDDDRVIIGSPHPDFTGGINANIGYGNWDLSTYLYFSVGNDLYKHYMFYTHYGALGSSYSRDRRDNSWSPDNPDGIYPMWASDANEAAETTSTSNSGYIADGSYLRMQNLTLGYSLPKAFQNKLGVTRLRIYGQISNLFTLTKYPGLEPENNNNGIDYGGYGMPRQFLFGVNLTF